MLRSEEVHTSCEILLPRSTRPDKPGCLIKMLGSRFTRQLLKPVRLLSGPSITSVRVVRSSSMSVSRSQKAASVEDGQVLAASRSAGTVKPFSEIPGEE